MVASVMPPVTGVHDCSPGVHVAAFPHPEREHRLADDSPVRIALRILEGEASEPVPSVGRHVVLRCIPAVVVRDHPIAEPHGGAKPEGTDSREPSSRRESETGS